MKKYLFLLMTALVLVACGNANADSENVNDNENINDTEDKENEIETLSSEDDVDEVEKELYIKMVTMLLNEYQDEYEEFDSEKGMGLFKLIHTVTAVNVDVVEQQREELLGAFNEEEYDIYNNLFDDIVELEKQFSHLDWSD